ncbi:dephospho-CoA kinase [Mycoplasmopsis ciconiae]|uniref:Dephospho-CoA kinase n=1 Tax=Mycoplasmopsis ciconiae TaxID=561067 RepID=A0ABU7MKH1_9BACT|nr:dephospho-CoA kinase [Mycoplasmopsis ciconiae]
MSIAITGRMASGKSYFVSYLKKLNYKVLICDDFVNELYVQNSHIKKQIMEKFGEEAYSNNIINKHFIKAKIIEDSSYLTYLQSLTYSYLYKHLQENKYDFVEIPILNNIFFDFSIFFSVIFNMQISDQKRREFLQKRNVDNLTIKAIDAKNDDFFSKNQLFNNVPIVNIPLEKRLNIQDIQKIVEEFKWAI